MRSFIFDANLYAQEASGDPAASSAPSRVVQRLQGSTESVTYLFGLTEDTPLEVGKLGFPTIPAVEPSPELDFDGFIHISLPLLEETQNAEIECVLGADYLPLPGEELEPEALAVTRQLAEHAMALARQFGRSVAQIGMLYPAEADYSYDPFPPLIRSWDSSPSIQNTRCSSSSPTPLPGLSRWRAAASTCSRTMTSQSITSTTSWTF